MSGSQETPKRKRVPGNGGAQRDELVNEVSREKPVQSIQRNTQRFKRKEEEEEEEMELLSWGSDTPMECVALPRFPGEKGDSDLIWVQCKPCDECYKQKAPLFDPKASSSYKIIPCDSDSCSALPQTSCGKANQCEYNYGYGDRSFVDGFFSSETIGFDSTGGRPVQIPKTLFGCTHRSNGTFNQDDAGLVGLGGGKLSLIRQLGSAIGGKFSYCLPSQSQSSATSKLNFGSHAVVSGTNAVTTPLITSIPDTFYFLNLEQVSVAGQAIAVEKSSDKLAVEEGNIIIDSGTTLTLIDDVTFHSVVRKVASSVSLPQVNDPNGIFSLCFDVYGARNNAKFPEITFRFSGGAAVVLHQENAFVYAAEDTVCLAIISSAINIGINIFGNIAQRNFNIGYDLTAKTITFAPTDCAKSHV
ncbi:Aspartic proteinase CDR1 [Apostasia shenzhenica]|uniref:Aspartic proteinase CDR1 n=1 Tax=Apostasia shenzhenica TaxID=1088818 RepID=A0A2I0A3L9_9ASPA|nr:Aspartic proteinase CDR1 [Apostasia shenzhenica]